MLIFRRCATFTGLVLLYLMVVFPMTLNLLYVKAGLFGLLILMVLLYWSASARLGLHREILIWGVLVATIGLFFSLTGVMGATPGALKQLQVYAFWPLVYTALLVGIRNDRDLILIHKTLVVSTISIAIYGLLILLTTLGELPPLAVVEWLSFEEVEGAGLREGFWAMRYQGMNSLPFLMPYVIAALVMGAGTGRGPLSRRSVLWAALVLALLVAVVSGRRGLQVVVVLAPLIFVWLGRHQVSRLRSVSYAGLGKLIVASIAILFALFVFLSIRYELSFTDMLASFMTGFDFSSAANESTYERREQWYALLEGWEQHPLLGNGHGASAAGSIRDVQMPWAYELFYVALLFQVGLLGLGAYTAAIVWIYRKGGVVINDGGTPGAQMLASLAGLTGVLIATATNPYLMRFDGLWVIFIPLAIINAWLLRRSADRCQMPMRPSTVS